MSPGTLSLVPCYRMTLLGMTFDIGADNQSEVLALHSPLLDRCVKQVGLGVRTAACEGFRPQRKAAAEASELAVNLTLLVAIFTLPAGEECELGERPGCERLRKAEWERAGGFGCGTLYPGPGPWGSYTVLLCPAG